MGLDISFKIVRRVTCPHCNHVVASKTVDVEASGGRGWYPLLEHFGYYVPPEKRTEENDWYGKPMELTIEQAKLVVRYAKRYGDLYCADAIAFMIESALSDNDIVVVEADW